MVPFIFIRHDGIFEVQDEVCKQIYDKGSSQYVDVAKRPDGWIYIGCLRGIFLLDTASNSTTKIYSHTTGFIRRIKLRRIASKNVLYFSADNGAEVTIYSLEHDNDAVLYHTIHRDDLMTPNWCPSPDGVGIEIDETHEIPSLYPPSYFAFDQNENLFVSNGPQRVCGFYRYSGAGEREVTGAPERIYYVADRPCYDLACRDSNTLYYITGKEKGSTSVEISRIDLLPLPINDESVYSGSDISKFNRDVKGFALLPEISNVSPEPPDVKWLQRSLNVIFYDSPPGPLDGVIGPKTRKVVKEFQQKYGLTTDGIPGPKTIAKIRKVLLKLT